MLNFKQIMDSYFVHWSDSPYLEPYSSYLKEVGALKFSHIELESHKMHYNDGIEVNFVISGTYRWNMEGKSYQLYPGEAFVACPWQLHGSTEQILDRGILSWLILKPESFARDGQLKLGPWSSLGKDTQAEIGKLLTQNTNPVLPKGTEIIDIYRQLNEELTGNHLGKEERISTLLDTLMLTVARAIQNRNIKKDRDTEFLRELEKAMYACFDDKVSMSDMAYQFGMSSSSFNKKVKALTGLSPADYLIDLKINRAKDRLADGNKTITQIAMECGFYSSQHFSTTFAKRTGMTPSSYRKRES